MNLRKVAIILWFAGAFSWFLNWLVNKEDFFSLLMAGMLLVLGILCLEYNRDKNKGEKQ